MLPGLAGICGMSAATVGGGGPPEMAGTETFEDRDSTGDPLEIAYPTGLQADDLAILQVISLSAVGDAHTISTPAGWTQIDQQQLATIVFYRQAIFYKRLTGAESGSVTVTTSIGTPPASHAFAATMSLHRGVVASGTPYEGLASATAQNANMAGAAVTTTGPDRTVLHFCACENDTLSTPAGTWDEKFDHVTISGNDDAGLKLYSKEATTAGVVGSAIHTLAASQRWGVIAFALLPD